jgi:hypothetical protein
MVRYPFDVLRAESEVEPLAMNVSLYTLNGPEIESTPSTKSPLAPFVKEGYFLPFVKGG